MSIAMSESYPRRTLRPLALVPLLGALTLGLALPVAPCSATGPTSVGCLLSEPEGYWPDIWLDAGAGRLYIADWPGARILIHDSSTLERVGEVTLASLLPGRPRQLAGHEGAGLVYAVVDRGWATSQSSVVVIDTRTLATRTLSNFGWHAAAQVDEQGRRLLVFANRGTYYRLTIVDVDTDVVVTTRDISALMNYSAQIGMGGLNPATGETVFLPNFDPGVPDRFALVNARTLAGE